MVYCFSFYLNTESKAKAEAYSTAANTADKVSGKVQEALAERKYRFVDYCFIYKWLVR